MNRPIDPDLDGYPDARSMDAPALRKALMQAVRHGAEERTENRRLKRERDAYRAALEKILKIDDEATNVYEAANAIAAVTHNALNGHEWP